MVADSRGAYRARGASRDSTDDQTHSAPWWAPGARNRDRTRRSHPTRPMRYGLHRLLTSLREDTPFVDQHLGDAFKRGIDIVLAIVLIALLTPFLIVAAVAVVATSKGPIIYRQQRVGRRGRTFRMLKFRSMVVDADQKTEEMAEMVRRGHLDAVDAPAFKCADDPRVTHVGQVLRRTSLDELPQLLNVLMGQMSLVGPRPVEQVEVDALPAELAEERQSVRPGITCLWQVLRYEDMPFRDRIDLDLLYVSRRSLVLDLALLALTPVAVVTGDSAY